MADYMVRATAAGGQVRAFAVTARDTVEFARAAHNTSPVATAALGRLLAGSAMMGAMMKGENDLLTIKIEGDGPIGGLTVTADGKGNVKGYAFHPEVMLPPNEKGKLDVGGALGIGVLTVIKDLGMKEPYVGQTILVTGEIAEDLTYYFATSEQTPSSVALGVLMNRENSSDDAGSCRRGGIRTGETAVRHGFRNVSFGRGKNAGGDFGICPWGLRRGDNGPAASTFSLQLFQRTD